jgi:hypothetical protein
MYIPKEVIRAVKENSKDKSKETMQCLLEMKYSRQFIRGRVLNEINNMNLTKDYDHAVKLVDNYRFGEYYESKEKRLQQLVLNSQEIVLEVLAAVCVNKGEQPIHATASRLANNLGYENTLEGIKTAAELIGLIGSETEALYWIVLPTRRKVLSTDSIVQLSEELSLFIEQCQYLPPMVCEPKYVKGKYNMDTSHISLKGSLILGKHTHHQELLDYEAINIANQVKLSLDEDILAFEERPSKSLDTQEKVIQFNKINIDSTNIYNEILEAGNKFWFTWKYDFRGRMYSQGYHINIQSTDYKKALISLAKKEVINCE